MMSWLNILLIYPTLAYTALTLALYALSYIPDPTTSRITSYYGRTLAAFGTLILCAVYGMTASVVLRLAGKGGLSQWSTARAFKWTMKYTSQVEFEIVQGEEHLRTRPAVFVGNHQTELDILFLGTIFPPYCSVTAKKSLQYMPFLGWFMALSKTVFIDRGNRSAAKSAFDGAAKVMRNERQSVFIFPEGTRSYATKPELLPFKKGAFHLAVQAQVPIVPVIVANYSDLLNAKKRIFRAGRVPIKVLPPIETKGLTPQDVDDLAQRTRDSMLREIVALTSKHLGGAHDRYEASAVASGVDSGRQKVANAL